MKKFKKIEFKIASFTSSSKSIFCIFYNLYIYIYIYIYIVSIKTSKNLSIKYYQENKERLQIKARERYQNFS